jgi:hypothetical protein
VAEVTKLVVLKSAADAVGEQALALYLNVPATHVRAWLAGAAPIPDQAFLHLVDVLGAALKQRTPGN